MKVSYNDLELIFKHKILNRINDISIGNFAYEVIEEIEKKYLINLSDKEINLLLNYSEKLTVEVKETGDEKNIISSIIINNQ